MIAVGDRALLGKHRVTVLAYEADGSVRVELGGHRPHRARPRGLVALGFLGVGLDGAHRWHAHRALLSQLRRADAAPPPGGELVAQPKPKTPRDPRFLDHLRRRPCDHCGATPSSEAAHYGVDRGVGLKASDYEACSLCHSCHDHWHRHGALPGLDRKADGHDLSIDVQRRGTARALVDYLPSDVAHRALVSAVLERRMR